ncbi:hypothetical protein D047_0077B, partial [Vibrio parahaemolyticus VPTS-2010_2]
GNLAIA